MQKITDIIRPRPLNDTLEAYWLAPSGEGNLASEWQDKPQRLIYDLLAYILWLEAGG